MLVGRMVNDVRAFAAAEVRRINFFKCISQKHVSGTQDPCGCQGGEQAKVEGGDRLEEQFRYHPTPGAEHQ